MTFHKKSALHTTQRHQSKNNTAAAEKWTGNQDFMHHNSDILQI